MHYTHTTYTLTMCVVKSSKFRKMCTLSDSYGIFRIHSLHARYSNKNLNLWLYLQPVSYMHSLILNLFADFKCWLYFRMYIVTACFSLFMLTFYLIYRRFIRAPSRTEPNRTLVVMNEWKQINSADNFDKFLLNESKTFKAIVYVYVFISALFFFLFRLTKRKRCLLLF